MADVPQQDRNLNLPRTQVGNRRYTKYDPTLALDIVERIAEGELLRDICNPKSPTPTVAKSTFLRWVSTVPELAKAYAAAQQISALAFEEMALDRAKRVSDEPGSTQNVAAANLYVNQLRWSAARRNPTKYSDKGNTQIVVPVNINTTLDLGKGTGSIDVEVPDMYTFSLPNGNQEPQTQIEDAQYEDLPPDQLDNREPGSATPSKTDLAKLLDTGPVVGSSHQPLFTPKPRTPTNTGPRKRVLIPGEQKPLRKNPGINTRRRLERQ